MACTGATKASKKKNEIRTDKIRLLTVSFGFILSFGFNRSVYIGLQMSMMSRQRNSSRFW